MIESVLIANRGEIAARIIKTAEKMGIRTVSLFTETDRGTPHTQLADKAVFLPDLPGHGEPYLDIERIITVARAEQVDAIHPGYGFLSENPEFAAACQKAGITFMGPDADAIRLMGDKGAAKQKMIENGVPCIPGYNGADQSDETLAIEAEKIGLPVLIKAAAGGGGRGMRLVEDMNDFESLLASARAEAASAFGSDAVILEKALTTVRHIEVQVAADAHGNVVHLFERDCTCQRRNQKVIEEAPSTVLEEDLRERLGADAVQAARSINYRGVGTVEFLMLPSGEYYFIEMNTRLQVEHPVTEYITGIDLVDWQFRIASDAPLPKEQADITFTGHAIEVRLYAEDPDENFLPQTGTVLEWSPATLPHIRNDHMIVPGRDISARYDPMIAKVIAWGESREQARRRLAKALRGQRLAGFRTNCAFLLRCLEHDYFRDNELDTGFIARLLDEPKAPVPHPLEQVAVASTYLVECRKWQSGPTDWSSLGNPFRHWHYKIEDTLKSCQVSIDGDRVRYQDPDSAVILDIRFEETGPHSMIGWIDDQAHPFTFWEENGETVLDFGEHTLALTANPFAAERDGDGASDNTIVAPMAGKIIAVEAQAGDRVDKGQAVILLEAMKMEHRLCVPRDAKVDRVSARIGDQVARGDILLALEAED
ncbi:acetyl/propionyl/methylcrotonyl-CoA carboxylase subunit alpha [Sneathiella chinensis]|uniref:3-methylcrotonyl-CoA carboxylase subunit alpha n=1 Tax=Sneathiella chinensis TaxID=349750 RepID=A0ABQ5U111_9PROT|nr:biotin carboxylase N-terminal domain-containing protein [Sneathiella chinensis]GLQ05549.1 3-methylcrotonyl-CoA carboxylase subunit alpha [Sneathiella chinensis]